MSAPTGTFTPGKYSPKALTAELRRLASESVTITNDGTPVTREQQLADMIWRQALGWEEETADKDGNRKLVKHPPIAWCQQFLWERLEGKAPVAVPEQGGGVKAADRVRDLAKTRLNALATAKAGPAGPPSHRPKKP